MAKPYKLPPGVRYLTDAERAARKAGKTAAREIERTGDDATGAGWQPKVRLPKKIRVGRKRFRPPPGIWGPPR